MYAEMAARPVSVVVIIREVNDALCGCGEYKACR
jgi:hypothetical protein